MRRDAINQMPREPLGDVAPPKASHLPSGVQERLPISLTSRGIGAGKIVTMVPSRAAAHCSSPIPRHLHYHDSADSRWASFGPPVPGVCGTAHVGTPSRGSSQTCSTHQTANTVISVNALSMSALFCVSIEESPHTLTRTLPNGVRQRYRPCLPTETNGFPQAVDQRRAARTFQAVPFNGIARRRVQLSIEIPRNVREYLFARVRRCAHACSSCFRNINRARWSRVFTFASETPAIAATSFVERPSISRMTTIIRYAGGRCFNAR
jgi:hypothetical protein